MQYNVYHMFVVLKSVTTTWLIKLLLSNDYSTFTWCLSMDP